MVNYECRRGRCCEFLWLVLVLMYFVVAWWFNLFIVQWLECSQYEMAHTEREREMHGGERGNVEMIWWVFYVACSWFISRSFILCCMQKVLECEYHDDDVMCTHLSHTQMGKSAFLYALRQSELEIEFLTLFSSPSLAVSSFSPSPRFSMSSPFALARDLFFLWRHQSISAITSEM